ncbi:imidazoleglycerol-phosphate dehydratase HisB [Aerococcus sp.]|uniref:imidazoleglycerol-phosphate dehydratase HisB n=1 Tax=Aerococcus sp. TaxID=1872398 RepID=UPI0025B9983C|nr:imidazoleglycerol-phosphate dehydratase HisB [Aerococcus sp.]MBR2130907.1 imidazoleglycerol-phosphate dehydratase HisB [Aerococcus sp.]
MKIKERNTLETQIKLGLAKADGSEQTSINTGVGFLDHMLTLFTFHSGLDLYVEAKGDTWVDDHHVTEDIGILLGEAIRDLYQAQPSYERYGSYFLPMDETLARVVLDLSGRPVLVYDANFSAEKVGTFDTELVKEFFYAVAMNARMTLHIDLLKNGNTHHEIEGIFKAFARALKTALKETDGGVPSSKGLIQ